MNIRELSIERVFLVIDIFSMSDLSARTLSICTSVIFFLFPVKKNSDMSL